jgi:hypothetical protein
MVTDVLKPTDSWTTPTEINDDYECYLTGEYDNIEPSFSDTSEVSDSDDITESSSSSVFDSVTEFKAESLLGSYSEPDSAEHTFDIGKFSFPSNVQVPEFIELTHYMQNIAVFNRMPHTLSYSLSYEDFDAVFQPDGAGYIRETKTSIYIYRRAAGRRLTIAVVTSRLIKRSL